MQLIFLLPNKSMSYSYMFTLSNYCIVGNFRGIYISRIQSKLFFAEFNFANRSIYLTFQCCKSPNARGCYPGTVLLLAMVSAAPGVAGCNSWRRKQLKGTQIALHLALQCCKSANA